MKAVMVMFDSLNRRLLSPYGCKWTSTPNFARLASRSATFETSYVCSMPCMPARRDLHTGRPNFLHRGWGPLEPYDDSFTEMLTAAGVYTHLATDHYHYWEDAASTYHNRYNSYQFFRGQEGDRHIGQLVDPVIPKNINGKGRRPDWVNREHVHGESDYPQTQTFNAGLDFINRNHAADKWFLQIECFDPHEPFCSPRSYKDRFPNHYDNYDGPVFDWPGYGPVVETPEQVEHARHEYASLLAMCDARLGDILDAFDRHDLWKDTLLVVWTDHGYLLGEHGGWAKNWPPLYDEIAHTPFFLWDPRCNASNVRRSALVQPAIDLAPTLLDFFGLKPTPDMLGRSLTETIATDAPVRQAAIYGYHGGRANVTDGRYVYLRGAVEDTNQPLAEYSVIPTRLRGAGAIKALQSAEMVDGWPFMKGCRPLRMQLNHTGTEAVTKHGHLLFDLKSDPTQIDPLTDPAVEKRMTDLLLALMSQCDSPVEQYARLGLK